MATSRHPTRTPRHRAKLSIAIWNTKLHAWLYRSLWTLSSSFGGLEVKCLAQWRTFAREAKSLCSLDGTESFTSPLFPQTEAVPPAVKLQDRFCVPLKVEPSFEAFENLKVLPRTTLYSRCQKVHSGFFHKLSSWSKLKVFLTVPILTVPAKSPLELVVRRTSRSQWAS